jgi:hypothetical protein
MGHGPVLAILLTLIVHIVGMALLFGMMGREILDVFRTTPRHDDDGGGGGPPTDQPVAPVPGGGGTLPLPDAEQAPKRLREPGRIGERYPRPTRRPEHRPEPARMPTPSE